MNTKPESKSKKIAKLNDLKPKKDVKGGRTVALEGLSGSNHNETFLRT